MKHYAILSFSVAALLFVASPQNGYSQSKAARPSRHYVVVETKGRLLSVDSTFDVNPNKQAVSLLAPYKKGLEGMMNTQIGYSEQLMKAASGNKPEGLLSNLIADILREKGCEILNGKQCDVALMNIGGIRSILPEGKIMVANIYEIAPFENTVAVLTLTGSQLKELLAEAAHVGAGISGAKIAVDKATRRLVEASVGGQPIEDTKSYTLATINYLAEGNDGFKVLGEKSVQRIVRDDILLRDAILGYVKNKTKLGEKLRSSIDGRFVYKTSND